ncbi:MAG: XrtA/PEP-CTERM system exopolysaccharide export protein [Pseudomonadota bacterium]
MLRTTVSKLVLTMSCIVVLAACRGGGIDAADITAQSPSDATEYQIGPGDALEIFVWDHDDLSTAVQVRPDGKISTPLVEDLQAAGRTPTQLARDIEGVLTEYVRSPVVTVIMQSFVGKADQLIRVVGQAVAPQSLQYAQGMTVLDVMIQVGGLSEFAAGNRSKLIRNVNGQRTEIRVRLDDLLNNGDIEQNVRMLPGDVIIIPESFF